MEYKEEFETRKDVKKMLVSDGKTLCFVPDGTGKYEFCSKDVDLQKWCEATKSKRVKENALKFVANGAREYLKGKTQLRDTSASVTANWKDNPVGTLQNVLQAKGKMPRYSEPEEGWLGGIGITLSVDGYDDVTKFAQNQKEARKACAIAFAEEYLGIDVKKEVQKVADAPKPQQTNQQPQNIKLPQTFVVSPDRCGDWEEDAVSALQIFCQKNKIALPEYFSRGTSQGYVTQSSMMMKLGDYTTTKTAGTKKEAKQLCAQAFYDEVLMAPRSQEQQKVHRPQKQDHGELDPSLFKGWKEHPYYTLEDYCSHYGIDLDVDIDVLGVKNPILIVGEETFSVYNPFHDEMSDSEIKDDLAKYFYKVKVEPILKKQQRQARDNTPAEALRDFPVPDMSQYQEKDNSAWAGFLNQLCAKAHLPLPEFVQAAIVKDGKETKCHFPNKFNLKGWRDDETRVMYLKMAGIDGKIRGEGKQFKDAQHDAAKNCLLLIWYDHKITEAQEDDNDKMVEFYTSQKQKLEKKCLVGTLIQKQQPQKQPEIKDFDQGLELLKAKFNGGRGGKD